MKRPHPASLILLGLAVLAAASSRDGGALYLASLVLTLAALFVAGGHLRLLLRRSRWLLLTMLIMFGWLTPGTPLPNLPGASQEGLLLAADNIARLIVALSIVALILKVLPPPELVAGMRSLLAPLAFLGVSRDRIAVRLALTLNEVEAARNGATGKLSMARMLTLPATVPGMADVAIGILVGAVVLVTWLA
ncbi:MAG: hypothetical protein A2040_05565 [Rhodocyclales bacterium GWA2_65_19]|nr:MAG: hypothetical protein A2040_05565 [Rhodocyclales bacterium GWA2_65_19]